MQLIVTVFPLHRLCSIFNGGKIRPGNLMAPTREKPPCDNFESAVLNELVAQLVEQRPFKAWVLGPSPSELTTHNKEIAGSRPDFQKHRCPTKMMQSESSAVPQRIQIASFS